MTLHPTPVSPVPEETARMARAAVPKGTVYLQLRDVLGSIYTDEQFADLFAVRGRPVISPWRLALVTAMQFAEGLSDRQAAEAVRGRMDWKYALGMELAAAGFDYAVLTAFRMRLVHGAAEQRLLDALLEACTARGLRKPRGWQRTDSPHVLGALRVLSRLERAAEARRAAGDPQCPGHGGARLAPGAGSARVVRPLRPTHRGLPLAQKAGGPAGRRGPSGHRGRTAPQPDSARRDAPRGALAARSLSTSCGNAGRRSTWWMLKGSTRCATPK
jgi:transposase